MVIYSTINMEDFLCIKEDIFSNYEDISNGKTEQLNEKKNTYDIQLYILYYSIFFWQQIIRLTLS